ncbi:predicted protein [Nematostella vectensis]|uniref:Uncharacterized protein n=1 Tax=Nematostella vectensis TaxID=45351 RepID=A7RU90_NEMVE|nr:predicted protein [Nematostella vectensis]|eukprot:XP_001637102.1 predicted protein [Nematostella vectensis]
MSSFLQKLVILLLLGLLLSAIILVERGLFGIYSVSSESFTIVAIIASPPLLYIITTYLKSSKGCGDAASPWRQKRNLIGVAFVTICSLAMCVFYLSWRGLWCTYHKQHHRKLCQAACDIQKTLTIKHIPIWITLGDLLASHRNRTMPFAWEHDLDFCVSRDNFQTDFTSEVHRGVFRTFATWIKPNHVYFEPLRIRQRHAEGLLIDVWECDPQFYGATPEEIRNGLNGSFIMVPYCGCMFAAPKVEHRDRIFRKFYGENYHVQKFAHHSWQCKIWVDH